VQFVQQIIPDEKINDLILTMITKQVEYEDCFAIIVI
jgi:hypothetical protein